MPISEDQIYQWIHDGKRPAEIRKLQARNLIRYRAQLKGYYRRARIATSARYRSTRQRAIRAMQKQSH